MARRHRPRVVRIAMALLVPGQVGTAIQCLHSLCSDEFCLSQDAVTTELVDCALLVSTYTLEGVTHSLPPGRSANNAEFDACQRSEIRLGFSSPVVTKYDCATTDVVDRSRYKCNQVTHGMDPWSPEGLTVTQGGGGGLYRYYCCSTDDCTANEPSDVGSGSDNSGQNPVVAASPPGFYYSQDPSWQDGTGRNCVCTTQWDADANDFDECVETAWANPLLQSDSLGECNAFSDQGTNTWRIKLQGIGTKPGFAFGVDDAVRDSWQAWCVNCEAGASQVHFYADDRCSSAALTSSFELRLDQCAVDDDRGVYYAASCGDSDIPAGPCPGTVAVEPLAFTIGVYSNDECRGAVVGGFEWRVPVRNVEAAPRGALGGEAWGAGGACISLSSLQTDGSDAGGFLLSELLQLRSTGGLVAATPLGRRYPRTPVPDVNNVAFRMCASHAGLTLAWYSDLTCSRPMVLSAPQIGDQATSSSELLSNNGTTGIEYQLSCTSAGELPLRSSRAQPLTADGLSILRRWLSVELNTTAVPVLNSCPTLPPAPAPDVDCAGDWKPCTAACERQRTWLGTRQPSGFGEACPSNRPCSGGEGECMDNTTVEAGSGIVLITIAIVLGLVSCFAVRRIVRAKRSGTVSPEAKNQYNKGDAADGSSFSSNDSTDSDEEINPIKQQLNHMESRKQPNEVVKPANGAFKAEKAAKVELTHVANEKQEDVQQKYQEQHGRAGSEHSGSTVYSDSSDGEAEKEILHQDTDDSAATHSPIAVWSSTESDSEDMSAKRGRLAGRTIAATRASVIMRAGRGGRGGRVSRGRGNVRSVARASFAFGRGRASTQPTRERVDSAPSEDSDESEIENASRASAEAARLRTKLAEANQQKARARARAKAIAKARSRGARGTYISDAAATVLPEPDAESESQCLPGQASGITQQAAEAARPRWLDDAPGGKNAQTKAAEAADRVPPKLRIPASMSSMDLKSGLGQQREAFSNSREQHAQDDAAMAKAKAKARARAVAAARQRQGIGGHDSNNSVAEGARNSAAAAPPRHNFRSEALHAAAAPDELLTSARKALRDLPADDIRSLRAMLVELHEQ